jgi:hypothetical protein
MSQISRLKDAEITNGNLINADDIDTELNQLVAESNSQDTRLGSLERKNGIIGPVPLYNASSSIKLKADLCARNSTNATDIEIVAEIILSLDSNGLNGLDTGTKTANTWYFVYLVKSTLTGTTGALFSTANEAGGGTITLPTGYDLKRQLPLAIRTDSGSAIMPFYISTGWPYRTSVRYRFAINPINETPATGQPNVLDGGTATTYTDISLAGYVPPIATLAILRGGIYQISNSGRLGYLRKKGASMDEFVIQNPAGRTSTEYEAEIVETDANQIIQYKMSDSASGMDLNVAGYIVTEVI